MAPKAAHEAAKKKAKKQKRILIVLAFPMIGACVYAYMTMSGLSGKTQVAAPASASAAATGPAAPTPASNASATSDTSATGDTAVTPGIAAVQITALHSFNALGRKDPFHDGGPKAGGASTSTTPTGTSSKSGGSKGSGGSGSSGKQQSAPLTGAVISINGKKLALAIGTQFGEAPGLSGVSLFRLVKVTATSALISVVGTQQTFTLRVKRPLTLQQNGGWTYTLILEPLGSPAPMTPVQTTTTSTIHDQGP